MPLATRPEVALLASREGLKTNRMEEWTTSFRIPSHTAWEHQHMARHNSDKGWVRNHARRSGPLGTS